MRCFHRFAGGLRALLFRGRAARDLDEDLRAYLDEAVDLQTAAGRNADEARRRVRLENGHLDAVKDRVRDAG